MQGLLGFRQQSMSGRKVSSASLESAWLFGEGSHTFVAEKAGEYEVAAWGAGGRSNTSADQRGTQGGFALKRVKLAKGQSLAITAARTGASTTVVGSGVNITITSGTTGPGTIGVNGAASGGDVNIDGVQTGGNAGLDGISYGRYKGGKGGTTTSVPAALGGSPGAGSASGSTDFTGGSGLVIVSRVS